MQGSTNKPPLRPYCPAQPPSFFGWLARFLGLTAPTYRGGGQPTGSTSGHAPHYRPPRPNAPAPCTGGESTGKQPAPIEQHGDNGGACLTEPVLLEGPVTIVIGARE
jgi:hypothetical protein